MDIRIGQGFDAHRFSSTRPLVLGGITIPHKYGLEGHSDADALTHAIIDSLLGARGLGDIGKWFPDNDPKYKNINSILLLKEVLKREFSIWKLLNLDATVIMQEPKLSPYIKNIRNSLAKVFKCKIDVISIKAKTTEGMGFCGRNEGIAVLANILIIKNENS